MIAEVRQTVSGMTADFEIVTSEGKIGTAFFPNNFLFGGPCLLYYRSVEYQLQYRPGPLGRNLTRPARDRRYVPYSITCAGQPYGELSGRTSSGGLFSRFDYDGLCVGNTEYEMFEVGLGKAGIAYPIYRNGTMVAEIDKSGTVYNNLDCYQVYAVDESALKNTVLLCLYLDARSFANRGEIMKSSVETLFYLTTNKKLKAKYDSSFKEKVARL